jgi:hypothetical protein
MAVFDGNIKSGYIDDVVTQGGTVSCRRHFINDNGWKVDAVTVLAFNKESTATALQPQTYEDILRKFGRDELVPFL